MPVGTCDCSQTSQLCWNESVLIEPMGWNLPCPIWLVVSCHLIYNTALNKRWDFLESILDLLRQSWKFWIRRCKHIPWFQVILGPSFLTLLKYCKLSFFRLMILFICGHQKIAVRSLGFIITHWFMLCYLFTVEPCLCNCHKGTLADRIGFNGLCSTRAANSFTVTKLN